MVNDETTDYRPEALDRLGAIVAGAGLAGMVAGAAIRAHADLAAAEARQLALQRQALAFAWWGLSPEAKRRHDPERFLRELLWAACTPGAYLWTMYELMAKRGAEW